MKNSTLTFILLSFLMGIPTIFAQKEINISSKNHSIHSFDLVANLVLVEGTLHKEAGWFILDTGMPDLILNKRYFYSCLLYTSPSPRDATLSRMPSSA